MVHNPLFHQVNRQVRAVDMRDQIQMALAIADASLLKSLLTNCMPALTEAALIGNITTEVGIPVGEHQSADGILLFESIRCVLAEGFISEISGTRQQQIRASKELARFTQHESEMQTLGQNLSLAPAIALLANAGFAPEQVNEILRLPHYAWHKSWWYAIDADGKFTIPFLRYIRAFHYPDGTITLQYKDFFEHDKPRSFTSEVQKVLIATRPADQGFAETLKHINHQREVLGIQRAMLICNLISELEAQAFMRQGISIYPARDFLTPTQASCIYCDRRECPLNGRSDSPVMQCRGFLIESEFV